MWTSVSPCPRHGDGGVDARGAAGDGEAGDGVDTGGGAGVDGLVVGGAREAGARGGGGPRAGGDGGEVRHPLRRRRVVAAQAEFESKT